MFCVACHLEAPINTKSARPIGSVSDLPIGYEYGLMETTHRDAGMMVGCRQLIPLALPGSREHPEHKSSRPEYGTGAQPSLGFRPE